MRKTKIVATIGPACSEENIFSEMCKKGLNVARFNFSHGTHGVAISSSRGTHSHVLPTTKGFPGSSVVKIYLPMQET